MIKIISYILITFYKIIKLRFNLKTNNKKC